MIETIAGWVVDTIPWWFTLWAIVSWSFLGTLHTVVLVQKPVPSPGKCILLVIMLGPLTWVIAVWVIVEMIAEGVVKRVRRRQN